jgi:hypothetical protein
MQVLNSGAHI